MIFQLYVNSDKIFYTKARNSEQATMNFHNRLGNYRDFGNSNYTNCVVEKISEAKLISKRNQLKAQILREMEHVDELNEVLNVH